jgi:hypothetical protein
VARNETNDGEVAQWIGMSVLDSIVNGDDRCSSPWRIRIFLHATRPPIAVDQRSDVAIPPQDVHEFHQHLSAVLWELCVFRSYRSVCDCSATGTSASTSSLGSLRASLLRPLTSHRRRCCRHLHHRPQQPQRRWHGHCRILQPQCRWHVLFCILPLLGWKLGPTKMLHLQREEEHELCTNHLSTTSGGPSSHISPNRGVAHLLSSLSATHA